MQFAGQRLSVAAALLFCVVAAPACTKVQARTPAPVPVADPPPLSTPEPPSRLKLPVSIDPPASTGTTTEKPAPAPGLRGRPPVTTSAGTTATPPATTTPPPEPVNAPVMQAGVEVEQRARERLKKAEDDLRRVQKTSLPPDARDQFDSAERFVRMAQEAMRAKNFVYAFYCADKAATLASLLVKQGGRSSEY